MVGLLDLVENLVRNLRRFALVGDEGLIDAEKLFVCNKRLAPSLRDRRHGVCGLDSNQEAALKIEDGVDVEENLMDNVARNHSLLLQGLLQVVQILQILDIFSFGIDKFLDDVISICHFGAGTGLSRLAIGIGLQLKEVSALFRKVKNVVNDLGNLLGVK